MVLKQQGPSSQGSIPQRSTNLSINIDQINNETSIALSPTWKVDETYRVNGVSIGKDYLRVEGVTVSRGELAASSIDIKEVVGQGAFSTVRRAYWRKEAKENNMKVKVQEVALKEFPILHSSGNRREMLLKELKILSKVDSPSLVKLHGAYLIGDRIALVLEYMNGGTLKSLLEQFKHQRYQKLEKSNKEPIIPEALISSISFQILRGLEYLHSSDHRMMHRDLKPTNVLYNRNLGSVKLCDFGMGSVLGETSLNTTLLGTSMYMSPERLRAQSYGRSSEIWSFGLILIECINGEPAWNGVRSIVDLIVTIEEACLSELVPQKLHVNPRLREIINVCLQVEPSKLTNHLFLSS